MLLAWNYHHYIDGLGWNSRKGKVAISFNLEDKVAIYTCPNKAQYWHHPQLGKKLEFAKDSCFCGKFLEEGNSQVYEFASSTHKPYRNFK